MVHSLRALLLASPLLALAAPAVADPNVEYGESYEAAYLEACGATAVASACQCSMEAIEEAISFSAFADLVAAHGGDLRRVLPDEVRARITERHCGVAELERPARLELAKPAN